MFFGEMGKKVKGVAAASCGSGISCEERKRAEEWALAKKQALESAKKTNSDKHKLIYIRAKKYAREYQSQQKELIRLKHEAKLKGGSYVNPEAKLLFIVRICGINAIDPKIKILPSSAFETDFQWCVLESKQSNIEHVAQG